MERAKASKQCRVTFADSVTKNGTSKCQLFRVKLSRNTAGETYQGFLVPSKISKSRLTLEDTQIPVEKKITKRNEHDGEESQDPPSQKNQIKNYNSSRITQPARIKSFSRKSTGREE